MTLIASMGSVLFIRGAFEFAIAARPITILPLCFTLDKVKRNEEILTESSQLINFHDITIEKFSGPVLLKVMHVRENILK